MIFPENFEQKIGFDEIRTLLKGRCMSTLGTEWVDSQLKFLSRYEDVREALEQVRDFIRFSEEEDDVLRRKLFRCPSGLDAHPSGAHTHGRT